MTEKKVKKKKNSSPNIAKMRKKAAKEAERKARRNRYILIGVFASVLFYIGMTVFFSSHFFLRTEINGYSCQLKNVKQVKAMMEKNCEEFNLVLEERGDQKETITSQEVVLQFVDDGKVEDILKSQKSFGWIGAIFKKPVYENAVTITYDEGAIESRVNGLSCMDQGKMVAPQQAYPSYDEGEEAFIIVNEELGTTIDGDVLTQAVKDALLSDQRILNLEEAGCYVEPKFYSKDDAVIEAADLMNKYLQTEITYDFGYTEEKVDKTKTWEWIVADEDANVLVDQEKVSDFVQWLANNYNTCGIRRKFKTPEGSIVTISGGTYGWRIDHSKEVEELMEVVKTGDKVKREPVYKQTGEKRDASGNDLHDTYIAISTASQTMWYYKDGVMKLTTPVVTGNPSKNMGTPQGVYAIAFKQRNHTLRGEDYESPVDYWMPFYEYRGIGIHDASWRNADQFGGEIYLTNGSHGCVNTPYDAVKTLFQIVETGTPVVVY